MPDCSRQPEQMADISGNYRLAKKDDPSRLINGNCGFNKNLSCQKAYGDPGGGDYVVTHLNDLPYKPVVRDDHQAASLGVFGGVGLFVWGHMCPVPDNAYRYTAGRRTLTDDFILYLVQLNQCMQYIEAIYTQTTDVEHGVNNILP